MKTQFELLTFVPGLLAAMPAVAGILVSAPIDVVGNVPLADFTTNNYAGQTYKDWGNEPFVAVNPLNTNQVVVSSFAPPVSTFSTTQGARIFYSIDGGANWTTQNLVPAPASGVGVSADWNFAYNSAGIPHGAVLGCTTPCNNVSAPTNVHQGMTANPAGGVGSWSYTGGGATINIAASAGNADQPWIALSGSRVFVAYDDFHSGTAERVAVSNNNGTAFTVDSPITNSPQTSPNNTVNPGTRVATDDNGNVYSIFGNGPQTSNGVHTVTYYLNRSRDGGVNWDFNTVAARHGITIDSGTSTQLCNMRPATRLRTTGSPTSTTCAATLRRSRLTAPARMFMR